MKKEKSKIMNKVKSLIGPIILCAIIVAGILVVINYDDGEEVEETIRVNAYDGSETPVVMENDELKFTLDPTTTQFTLEVKDTGKVWYSNPQDADEDTIALTNEKNKLKSTIAMTYSNTTGLQTLYNNYEYSIEKGIYEIEQGEDYVKVNYSMGDTEKEFVIPPVAKEDDFKKLMENMSKSNANMIQQYYKKYDINDLGKKDNKEELLASYPILEQTPIYVLRDTTKEGMKVKFQTYFEEAGYTYDQYLADKELNHAVKSSDKPIFNANMIYRLDGSDLVVEVPLKELEFKEEYPIYNLTILPYFGAAGKQDTGFMMVPEGGGALIRFNNGKTAQNAYYSNMYGWDMALSRESVVHNTRSTYNTFGISNGDDSFLCMMEDGVAYAAVQADISGRYNDYNYVNAQYSIMLCEQYDVGDIANSSVYVYLKELPDESLVQRYRFVNSGSYVDMAKEYQAYLEDKYEGYFVKQENDTQAPMVLEVVGAIDKVKQVFGVPVSRPWKLTTYEEAGEMVRNLKEEGIENLTVKMTGWCNGGEKQKVLNSVKTISELGSKKDLQNMIQNASANGVDVYLDGITQYAYDSDILDGFSTFRDAARFITKERAELFEYSEITYSAREGIDSYWLLHNEEALKMADNLTKAANEFGAGVSFRDTGMDLSADYYLKNTVSRQAALQKQQEQLRKMADADSNVMINMGNDYAVAYSDVITNMDFKGSEYTILDEAVPFYQIALHGYVDYTGEALNLAGNTEEELLCAAEYGAGLSFTMMQETAFALQKTLYTEYYGSDYTAWHDRMLSIYNRYNEELGHTFDQQIVGHEKLNHEVSCTTYEDGTKVYVNYSYAESETADGVKIPARDYKVVR